MPRTRQDEPETPEPEPETPPDDTRSWRERMAADGKVSDPDVAPVEPES